MTDREKRAQTVADFWKGVDSHDWDLVASTLADDFVRIGMRDNEADTCRGKENYIAFVSGVISRMVEHELQSRFTFLSEDGRFAFNEAVEIITYAPGEEPLAMRFANYLELNDEGLISKLDIFWKTPPQMPPDWIAVEAVIGDAAGE
ncbi:nuclear transport factor 2 family protein [Yinghuangia soli]|uniref:Nuclear transport factor 2 family protein n=1 Tax=Yinghuangia soli TaxID=2908204 RepID=A0AA41PUA9_9ACTN|nr:nuclear transport factor 2 family protein [Yinghuangia soli]MCF2526009.1 nuclear transport factor 2 family protein [Yinghuangia soli]